MKPDINLINNDLLRFSVETNTLDVETGKMGLCLYFYHIADLKKSKLLRQHADSLFNQTCNLISTSSSKLTIFEIAQIGLCIDYLIKHEFVQGNVNYILKDFDDIFFIKVPTLLWSQHKPTELVVVLYYMIRRIEEIKDRYDFFLMSKLCIHSINNYYSDSFKNLFGESYIFSLDYSLPPTIFLFTALLRTKIYNNRVEKIMNEISGLVKSRIPIMGANRLYLLWSLVILKQTTISNFWNDHIDLLRRQININQIIKTEFRNKNLST